MESYIACDEAYPERHSLQIQDDSKKYRLAFWNIYVHAIYIGLLGGSSHWHTGIQHSKV